MKIAYKLWSVVPTALRNRPFGVYVSTLVFALGIYGLVDGPDHYNSNTIMNGTIIVISLYFILASLAVITSLIIDPREHPAFSIFGEMYGWLFISGAALATSVLYLLEPIFAFVERDQGVAALWVFAWTMLAITSFVRALDILITNRGKNK